MVLASVVDVSPTDMISEAHTLPSVHGRAKMHWTRPFWRITTSPLSVSSCDLTFESTEFSRARLGPQMVRSNVSCHFHSVTYLNSDTR